MSHSLFTSKYFAPLTRLLFLLVVLAALAYQQRSDGRLHVFLPALKGDAIILQLPNGEFVLIDGGADPATLSAALGRRMPYWKRQLAMVILTSKDSRHLPGQVAALAHYRVGRVLATPDAMQGSGAMLREWRRLLDLQSVSVEQLRDGQSLLLAAGVRLRVLALGEGCVLLIEYGKTAAVLAHTATPDMYALKPPRRAQLVIFPWEYDPHTPLLEALQAQAVIYSDGVQADEPVRLSMHDRRIGKATQYHEVLHGNIEWISDGRQVLVRTERGK